ncbi:MAG: hypothetical protein IPM29_27795 [Planctomycetes bacterium]|nr:hypothetical protein [Planctomycetota bacterium]
MTKPSTLRPVALATQLAAPAAIPQLVAESGTVRNLGGGCGRAVDHAVLLPNGWLAFRV